MTSRIPANISEIVFDVLIIGAGINGAGIARDAAMRGLRVLLLDKGDISAGTTSWSTRLIHGGLRYLEHGELGLVRESLRERETLFRIAPHLVKALPILIPIYEGNKRLPMTIRAGMIGYDLLSFGKSLPRHRILTRAEAIEAAPGLNPNGLLAAAIYYDAQVEFAERLVLENVISAREHGAVVITYGKVRRLLSDDGAVHGVEFSEVLGERTLAARGSIVVNAAGPWVDHILENARQPPKRLIGGTKGSHLIVAPFAGAPATALYVEAEADNRPFFIIPWNGKYLIGTTDIRFKGDLDRVEIEDTEIDYLLRETNRVIPGAGITRNSVLYSYSGVRPLPYTEHTEEQSITRRHFIHDHAQMPGLITIVGGKLTTYRSLAEQAVNLVFRKLGKTVAKCLTSEAALPGAEAANIKSFSDQFEMEYGLPSQTNKHLLGVYGTRTANVLELASADKSLAEVFDRETGAIASEVIFSFQHELAQTLADCLLRRTMVGLNSTLGVGADEAAARIAQKHLGWSETRAQQELAAYRDYVKRFQPHPKRTADRASQV